MSRSASRLFSAPSPFSPASSFSCSAWSANTSAGFTSIKPALRSTSFATSCAADPGNSCPGIPRHPFMNPQEYAAMFQAEQTHWWYHALHRLIFDSLGHELPDWRDRMILDAGCGTGAILEQLGHPDQNTGVDLA